MQVDPEVKEINISGVIRYESPSASDVAPEYFRDPIVPAEFVREILGDVIRRRTDRQRFYRRKKSQARNWRKWRA